MDELLYLKKRGYLHTPLLPICEFVLTVIPLDNTMLTTILDNAVKFLALVLVLVVKAAEISDCLATR